MKIKRVTSQSRQDFVAVFVCEICGSEETKHGYDDDYYHKKVIPTMACRKCGKKSGGEG